MFKNNIGLTKINQLAQFLYQYNFGVFMKNLLILIRTELKLVSHNKSVINFIVIFVKFQGFKMNY